MRGRDAQANFSNKRLASSDLCFFAIACVFSTPTIVNELYAPFFLLFFSSFFFTINNEQQSPINLQTTTDAAINMLGIRRVLRIFVSIVTTSSSTYCLFANGRTVVLRFCPLAFLFSTHPFDSFFVELGESFPSTYSEGIFFEWAVTVTPLKRSVTIFIEVKNVDFADSKK